MPLGEGADQAVRDWPQVRGRSVGSAAVPIRKNGAIEQESISEVFLDGLGGFPMAEEQLTLEAQEALDELWNEGRLTYKVKAHRVTPLKDVAEYYTVEFFDDRRYPVIVWWKPERQSFKSAVRTAMLRHTWRKADSASN